MQGIWFWCLFGFGIGSVMVYRAKPLTELPTELGARAVNEKESNHVVAKGGDRHVGCLWPFGRR